MAAVGTKRALQESGSKQDVCKKRKDKCRVDNCLSYMGHIHKDVTENLLIVIMMELRNLIDKRCSAFIKINRLTVLNSNAIDGSSFSKAFCRISASNDEFSFVSLFNKGVEMLMTYIGDREMPLDDQEKLVLDTLLHYLIKITNENAQAPFGVLELLGETDVAIILANHLFGKLCTSSHFLIDKQGKGKCRSKESCPCANKDCQMTGSYGYTGIGNPSVWHGNLDVIVNNQVAIEAIEDDPDCDSPGRTPMDEKGKSTCLSRNAQVIAETIVFSFLQKKRHPEYSHFLFPCIGVSRKEMVVYFYDSEHDVLLESSSIPLRTVEGNVNVVSIIVSWLVVNHKYFCGGLTEELKKETSGFFCQAEQALPIYENQLQFGDIDVGISWPKPKHRFNYVDDPSRVKTEKNWAEMIAKKLG
ncbi:uncharacterized protein LOC117317896 [Pecten maximus]|uniref:uncharacterized protein LOC117317896 n=1 Tax=Pecten maximus TaxID=6579 RepID=UPI001458C6C3|nr:uncharacterized protein LOC117317896 [Pecten maximus]